MSFLIVKLYCNGYLDWKNNVNFDNAKGQQLSQLKVFGSKWLSQKAEICSFVITIEKKKKTEEREREKEREIGVYENRKSRSYIK